MSILTTCIGAYPKPAFVKLPDWFNLPAGPDTSEPTAQWGTAMQQLGGAARDFHVRQLETDALELADGLAELFARGRVVACQLKRAVASSQTNRRDLQSGVAEPLIGDIESLVDFAQYLRGRDPAIIELKNEVVIAAVRDAAVAAPHGESWRAFVDQERGDFFARAARGLFHAGGGEQNNKVGDIGVADKMFDAVDAVVATGVAFGCACHRANVGAGAGFGHCQAVGFLAADAWIQVLFALLADAGLQNVARPRDRVLQCHVGAAEFAVEKTHR